jgi:hypothetical protein
VCNLHIIFLLKITPRYFALLADGMFHVFNLKWT